jgi:hypothetical protein
MFLDSGSSRPRTRRWRFPDAAWHAFLPEPPPGPLPVSTNYYFGWQSIYSNRAIVVDWRFQCLTNRAAFWD